MSLARPPALVLGTILTAVGLYLLYRAHSFPRSSNFPSGTAHADGKFLFGLFAANGWTGMFTAVAGGLLLFGAAQHLLAKTMSLIVGVALGAAAVIALISGDVLGMAAANHLTELGWAVCAVILLVNATVVRRRRTVVVADPAVEDGVAADRAVADDGAVHRGTAAGEPAMAETRAHEPGMAETRAHEPAMAETRAHEPSAAGTRVNQIGTADEATRVREQPAGTDPQAGPPSER